MGEGTDRGSKLAYFLAGGGIGAIVALLFAPRTGRETRDFIVPADGRQPGTGRLGNPRHFRQDVRIISTRALKKARKPSAPKETRFPRPSRLASRPIRKKRASRIRSPSSEPDRQGQDTRH